MESNNAIEVCRFICVPCGCTCFVYEIRIKDVKAISKNCLWRWVVIIVMCSIILIPHISCSDPIRIFGFSWSIFISPVIYYSRWVWRSTSRFRINEIIKFFILFSIIKFRINNTHINSIIYFFSLINSN